MNCQIINNTESDTGDAVYTRVNLGVKFYSIIYTYGQIELQKVHLKMGNMICVGIEVVKHLKLHSVVIVLALYTYTVHYVIQHKILPCMIVIKCL